MYSMVPWLVKRPGPDSRRTLKTRGELLAGKLGGSGRREGQEWGCGAVHILAVGCPERVPLSGREAGGRCVGGRCVGGRLVKGRQCRGEQDRRRGLGAGDQAGGCHGEQLTRLHRFDAKVRTPTTARVHPASALLPDRWRDCVGLRLAPSSSAEWFDLRRCFERFRVQGMQDRQIRINPPKTQTADPKAGRKCWVLGFRFHSLRRGGRLGQGDVGFLRGRGERINYRGRRLNHRLRDDRQGNLGCP